jgi:hypothetical protein
VGLAVVGGGGGQFSIGIDAGRPVSLHVGLPPRETPTAWLAADTLADVLAGRTKVTTARAAGRLTTEPPAGLPEAVLAALA